MRFIQIGCIISSSRSAGKAMRFTFGTDRVGKLEFKKGALFIILYQIAASCAILHDQVCKYRIRIKCLIIVLFWNVYDVSYMQLYLYRLTLVSLNFVSTIYFNL